MEEDWSSFCSENKNQKGLRVYRILSYDNLQA